MSARGYVGKSRARPDAVIVQTVISGGCGARVPCCPGEPPPAPIGPRVAGSAGARPWTDHDNDMAREAQLQWSVDALQPCRQVGRLDMLARIATHEPEAT